MTHNYIGVGWRAAVLRQLAGLDQIEAAKRSGITLKTWQKMEAGNPCRDATIFAVAHAFQCSRLWVKYGMDVADNEFAALVTGRRS